MEKKFDLEGWLIDFASDIIDISETLPKSFAGITWGANCCEAAPRLLFTMERRKLLKAPLILFIK